MQIVNLSPQPHLPCYLLKWEDISILLDCSIDLSSLANYLPHVYRSSRTANFHQSKRFNIPYLKDINGFTYVEGVPEIHIGALSALRMETVDVILISNLDSLLGLPFFTEGVGFRGQVYATEPVLQFGKLMMKEMLDYFDRFDVAEIDSRWKIEDICCYFQNPPIKNPQEWRKFFNKQKMEKSISRIIGVAFDQDIKVFKTTIRALRNGYTIGSANWSIKNEEDSIAYISPSAVLPTHAAPFDQEGLQKHDSIILSSLSTLQRFSKFTPEDYFRDFMHATTETLKKRGNVLIPTHSSGHVFDYILQIAHAIGTGTGIDQETKIYFISPVAKSMLAFANVNAEWLSESKQNNVYTPEEPFPFPKLIREGRLEIYESLYGDFSKMFKSPCVIFTGHPSLRIGDAAHLIDLWGNDQRSLVLTTCPDYGEEAYGPFKHLQIRHLHIPIETRIDWASAQKLLYTLLPKKLFLPSIYTQSLGQGLQDFVINYKPNGDNSYQTFPLRTDELVTVYTQRKGTKRKVDVHPTLLKEFVIKGRNGLPDYGVHPLNANLRLYDDSCGIVPPRKNKAPRKRYVGKLNYDLLKKKCEEKFKVKETKMDDGSITLKLEENGVIFFVSADRLKTRIHSMKEYRTLGMELLTPALTPFLE